MKIKAETSTSRLFYLDWLKFIAILMVIAIHVASIAIYNYTDYAINRQTWNWLAPIFYNSLGHCAIGIFFMISGVLLLNPHRPLESPGSFFKRRIWKILSVYIAWQIIYFFWIRRGLSWIEIRAQLLQLKTWLNFIFYPSYYHLWYLQALLWVYLATPAIRQWLSVATKKNLEYVLLLWLLLVGGGFFLSRWSGGELWNYSYLLRLSGFYLLGYYFAYTFSPSNSENKNLGPSYLEKFYNHYQKLSPRQADLILLSLYTVSILIIVFSTWFFTAQQGGAYDAYWENYLSFPNVIASISLFLWAARQKWTFFTEKKPKIGQALSQISQLSLGIYLIHVILLEIMRHSWFTQNFIPLDGTWPNLWLGIPLVSLIVYFFCYWAIKIAQRLPLLKKIV